ncbi:MAG: FAD-binding protein [Hyphomicrobiales bacterium]|nr:FAD-binding protein [Hyphomicrobiales bacterium]
MSQRALRGNSLDAALAETHNVIGKRLERSEAIREQHAHGESWHKAGLPDAVAFVESKAEVAAIAAICNAHKVPLIAFGTGTSLEGHVTAVQGGITMDMSRMNRMIAINAEDCDAVVEPGVTRLQLNEAARHHGLMFTVDPGADASLGGMASTRASGTNAVRYGTMKENVLALEIVLSDGRIIRTGTRARKSAAGYDLTKLFVGAEGTLGVITELTLRLFGIPETVISAVCSFHTLENAINTVTQLIQFGVPIARVELLDDVQMDAVNRYSGLNYPAVPTLFFEFHGTKISAADHVSIAREVSRENSGSDFLWAEKEEERAKLWKARHTAYYAALALRPGSKGWSTDVCVPISRLAECILETKRDIIETGLLAPIVGHVGDGNFHLAHVLDPNDKALLEKTYAFNKRLVRRALDMGGTCTGEHGIGNGKIESLQAEAGASVDVMRDIKRVLDPNNIMNPGKIFLTNAGQKASAIDYAF